MLRGVMLALGCLWIYVVLWRLDGCIDRLRESKNFYERAVVIVILLITLLIIGIVGGELGIRPY
ncbi:hypothetical protein LLG95_18540 [bacterium]|nr:hypothetical protein [bacterium]